jgi:AraC-like DNA-binding protein
MEKSFDQLAHLIRTHEQFQLMNEVLYEACGGAPSINLNRTKSFSKKHLSVKLTTNYEFQLFLNVEVVKGDNIALCDKIAALIKLQLEKMINDLLLIQEEYIDHVSETVDVIQSFYKDPLTLKEIANKVHLSPWHLSRLFSESKGISIMEYLETVRLVEAKRLLKETTLPITHIAMEVGYNSLNSFSRTFKKKYDCSPGVYRKNVQQR